MNRNHAISMRSGSGDVVLMDREYAVAVYYIAVIDLDSVDPLTLSLPEFDNGRGGHK